MNFMPLFDSNDFHLGGDGRKDSIETSYTMRGKLDSSINGVDDPTKNDFPSIPRTISFQHFLDRDSFLEVTIIVKVQGTKHFVHGMQKGPFDTTLMVLVAFK